MWRVTFLSFLIAPFAVAQGTVESFFFATKHPPPAAQLPPALKPQAAMIHLGMKALPESTLVAGGMGFGKMLGLNQNQIDALAPHLAMLRAFVAHGEK